jgi:CHASE2 domain-containing sensor protein
VRACRAGRGRPLGLALLAALVVLGAFPELPVRRALRHAALDAYHAVRPRVPASAPAVVVDVDEASLRRHGQWPWPRARLAELLARIGAARPAAIGIDILMPEPDRLSPPRLAAHLPGIAPELAGRLAQLPDSDAMLAGTLGALPVALGLAGVDEAVGGAGRRAPVRLVGEDPTARLRRFPGAVRSLALLDTAAPGHGLLNAGPEGGTVRRVTLVGLVGDDPVPGLAIEMIRLAAGAPALTLHGDRRGLAAVGIGGVRIPAAPDGTAWLRFAPHDPERFVSAADVLAGLVPPERLAHRLVLVGVTALGLVDARPTPVGDRMPGVEIHAQLLESLVDGSLLVRPRWAEESELAALGAAGLLLVLAAPRLRVRGTLALVTALVAACLGTGIVLYDRAGLLLDAVFPAAGASLCFVGMLAGTLAEADSQRRALRQALADAREAAARLAGELQAARRIQLGLLPRPATVLAGDARVELEAALEPARLVGGDLYDFFRLAGDRLCLVIGDVSGKGLPAALFMALTKSVLRSQAVRAEGRVASAMRGANAELGRDNPEALFVTCVAAVLDLATGTLELCNAGHERPYVVAPGVPPRVLDAGGGPPLGVLEAFPYTQASYQLEPGQALCLVTDGVTEATDARGALYGRARLEALLATLPASGEPRAIAEAIRQDVTRFAGGTEPGDDLALVVVRWRGPGAGPVSGR